MRHFKVVYIALIALAPSIARPLTEEGKPAAAENTSAVLATTCRSLFGMGGIEDLLNSPFNARMEADAIFYTAYGKHLPEDSPLFADDATSRLVDDGQFGLMRHDDCSAR